MRIKREITAGVGFLFLFILTADAAFRLVPGIDSASIRQVAVSLLEPSRIYAASANSLYKSTDGGVTFHKIKVFVGEEIQQVLFDPRLAGAAYVATDSHVYEAGGGIKKLYSASPGEVIYCTAKDKGRLYVGGSRGLYRAPADSLIWNKVKQFNGVYVYGIELSDGKIYLATDRGVYSLRGKNRVKRLFTARKPEADIQDGGEEEQEDVGAGLTANAVKQDIFKKSRLWLGTNRGLYISEDSGNNWRKVYLTGISDIDINCLAQTPLETDSVYLGTKSGFFAVNIRRNRSRQIFEGISADCISDIAFSPEGRVYLATSGGLFQSGYFTAPSHGALKELPEREPSIQQVQQEALRYNQVHPDKIKKWRNALKYRAFFPDVDLDYDKTIWGSYTSGGAHHVGPRDWGVSLSWDTGDLIWNSYEDDIDTKARLNTQLRLDILDEVNRVYFERLRLKKEIASLRADDDKMFDRQLRLSELTAILDGYTGGFFSKKIKELNGR